jgi:large subunit ribosomal protein L22e
LLRSNLTGVVQFVINASQPASDKIFDVSAFEKFLNEKIKVDGRVGNLGETIKISQQGDGKVEIIAHNELSGRYLKYLYVPRSISRNTHLANCAHSTKKFLKKQQLRDWLRVVSTSKGVYELKFFNVVNDDAEEDDE